MSIKRGEKNKEEAMGNVKGYDDIKIQVEDIIKQNQTIEDTVTKIKGELAGNWKTVPVNVCLLGEKSAGKSSFITNVLGENGDETAIKKTTNSAFRYSHPDDEKLCFWDMPGYGTMRYPNIKEYVTAMDIKRFDMAILFHKGCFKPADAALLTHVTNTGKPSFIVRSFFDIDSQDGGKIEEIKESILSEIDDYFPAVQAHVQDDGSKKRIVYFISNKSHNFDFEILMNGIFKELQYANERNAYYSIENITDIVIASKKDGLKKRTWGIAAIAGAIGIIPYPGLDVVINVCMMMKQVFSMEKTLGIDEGVSRKSINSYGKYISTAKLIFLITQMAVKVGALTFDDPNKALPTISVAVSSITNFIIAKQTLTDILDDFILLAREKIQIDQSKWLDIS